MTNGTKRGEGSASRPGRSLPPGKTRYSLHRRLRGPQGRSGQLRKILPPPGFDSRAIQPVASRYIDHATRSSLQSIASFKIVREGSFYVQTLAVIQILVLLYVKHRLRWSRGSVLAFGAQVRGFKPGRSRRIFKGEKILSTPFFGGEVKPSVPCRRFAACKYF